MGKSLFYKILIYTIAFQGFSQLETRQWEQTSSRSSQGKFIIGQDQSCVRIYDKRSMGP